MSQKTNPAKLGVFVLIAIAVAMGTLAVISSGRLFKKTVPFVMYFDADASGLKVGAPVLFRGVAIGQVTKIQLVFDSDRQDALVPVYIDVDPSRFVLKGESEHYPMMEDLVEEGLRAQLQTQSFVTGMLQVMLVHMPEVPVSLKGGNAGIREIPTAPGLTQILADEFKNLNLHEIVTDARNTMAEIHETSKELKESEVFAKLNTLLEEMHALTAMLNQEIPAVTEEVKTTMSASRDLLKNGQATLKRLDNMVAEIEASTPDFMTSAQANSEHLLELQLAMTQMLKEANGMLSTDSPLRYNLSALADRINKTSIKLGTFLDTLEQNPESFITGKPTQP
jgi:paraquat-inducible protein B